MRFHKHTKVSISSSGSYSWPAKVLLVLGCLFFFNTSQACICWDQPPLPESIQAYDAIFIGVLEDIHSFDSLYPANYGRLPSYHYVNFKVIRYNKGLNDGSDYVSAFDDYMSSCSGFLSSARIGDTLLVFADFIEGYTIRFLRGNQCTRWAFISQVDLQDRKAGKTRLLDESELAFVNDSTQWKVVYPKQIFSRNIKEAPLTKNSWNFEFSILSVSILLNLAFLFYFIKTPKNL